MTGIAVPVGLELLGSNGGGPAAPGGAQSLPERATDLEIVDLSVSEDAHVRIETDGFSTKVPTSLLDLSVRNVGELVSVIHRLDVEVTAQRILEPCSGAGGALTVSAGYDLVLPITDPVGSVVPVEVRQEVRPNTADRLQVTVWLPDDAGAPPTGYLYALRLRLYHDVALEPLDVGRVVLAIPLQNFQLYFEDEFAEADPDGKSCLAKNRDSLADIASLPGARAPGFIEAVASFVSAP